MSDCMLIMGKGAKIDPTLRKETMAFLEKLTTDDSAPGLHIEPINNSVDKRVRTGRVTLQFRAVLFRLTEIAGRAYVFVGVWNHDDAIDRARKAKMTVNPVNGITEIRYVEEADPRSPTRLRSPPPRGPVISPPCSATPPPSSAKSSASTRQPLKPPR